jgi:hypothetical protein
LRAVNTAPPATGNDGIYPGVTLSLSTPRLRTRSLSVLVKIVMTLALEEGVFRSFRSIIFQVKLDLGNLMHMHNIHPDVAESILKAFDIGTSEMFHMELQINRNCISFVCLNTFLNEVDVGSYM